MAGTDKRMAAAASHLAPAPLVPRLWPGSTIVCLASGPSLTQADVDACLAQARVVAVKDSIRIAPWADVLYACGADTGRWWTMNGPLLEGYMGLRFTLDPKAARWATVLRNTGRTGLETDPAGLRTGSNSGYQAINLAVHLGAAKIILLGYDMRADAAGRDHFFGQHPYRAQGLGELYADWRPLFATLREPLAALGVEVINASRVTALEAFPCRPLEEALG